MSKVIIARPGIKLPKHKKHLVARLHSDLLGELTVLPRPPSWIQRDARMEGQRIEMEKGKGG